MLHFTVIPFSRNKLHMVKVVIRATHELGKKNDPKQELFDMKNKLQHIIPGSVQAKYVLTNDDLSITMQSNTPSKAITFAAKVPQYIDDAAHSLHYKVRNG
ncbi:MAG: hypothetical protein EBR02_00385 [Alphaproteobacteria bacterium]|nr:hypothetical protein [Alphaproteobacteria bacterium]